MSNVFIESDDEGYKAIQNRKVIARGNTQLETGEKAHDMRPNDTILAERQRHTDEGSPDKWRRMFGPKH
jgi:hypothetical protein